MPDEPLKKSQNLVEGIDYYIENGCWVFTAVYLLRRGNCCNSGCRHCPYPKASLSASKKPEEDRPRENSS